MQTEITNLWIQGTSDVTNPSDTVNIRMVQTFGCYQSLDVGKLWKFLILSTGSEPPI